MSGYLVQLRHKLARAGRRALGLVQPASQTREAVASALGRPVQTKLTLGSPDDIHEREADAMADRVMRMPQPSPADGETVQRKCAACQEEDERVRRSTRPEEDEEEEVKTKATGAGGETGTVAADAASRIQSRRGSGEPLPTSERAFFEPRFGRPLGDVHVHADAGSADLSQRLSARAFTVGRDVFFGRGEYRPGTTSGRQLLAHELTHVLQHRKGDDGPVHRMAINQTSFKKGKCGERNVQWKFSLDSAAASDGYIVQMVAPVELKTSCGALVPVPGVQTYWEAWKVAKGDTVDWTTTRDGWTDASGYPASPTTWGNQITPGVVKYFPTTVTGDLGDFGVAPAGSSDWGPGKVPRAGALPSTDKKPSWWDNKPVEGPKSRVASSVWNCCDSDSAKHTSEVTAAP